MRVSEGWEELSDCLGQCSCVLHGGNGGGGGFNDHPVGPGHHSHSRGLGLEPTTSTLDFAI